MNNSNQPIFNLQEEMLLFHKKKVITLYKEGYSLRELCMEFCLDISSILFVLRKSKLKRKTIYSAYREQATRNENRKSDNSLKEDKIYLDKFFAQSELDGFTSSYFSYWKENYKKLEEKRAKCTHRIRTIRCSLCDAILADASKIPL